MLATGAAGGPSSDTPERATRSTISNTTSPCVQHAIEPVVRKAEQELDGGLAAGTLRQHVGRLDRELERQRERLEGLHAAHERARHESRHGLFSESRSDRQRFASAALRQRS